MRITYMNKEKIGTIKTIRRYTIKQPMESRFGVLTRGIFNMSINDRPLQNEEKKNAYNVHFKVLV